jgi:hypothetical protein
MKLWLNQWNFWFGLRLCRAWSMPYS